MSDRNILGSDPQMSDEERLKALITQIFYHHDIQRDFNNSYSRALKGEAVLWQDFSSEKMFHTMREMRSADSDSRKEKI